MGIGPSNWSQTPSHSACRSSSSSLFGMHHQCVAPLAANSPHSGLSRAISIASSKVRLCRDRSVFRVAIQEEWRRPTGLLQSLWGTAVRILLASADLSILIRYRWSSHKPDGRQALLSISPAVYLPSCRASLSSFGQHIITLLGDKRTCVRGENPP